MNELIFEVVKLVVMAIVGGVCLYVVPYIKPYIKKVISKENLELIDRWALNAVYFAEQVMKDQPGNKKKEAVMEFMSKVRDESGIKITDEQISVLVEAAVRSMKSEE